MAGTRTANGQRANGSNSNGGKSNKFKNAAGAAGAAAGGFVGAMGQSVVPPLNITFNRTQNIGAGGGGGGGKFALPEPVFDGTDDIRAYCNHVRALMISCAIELAMASKILEARLAQVPPRPDESAATARIRAKRVAWKLKRASDGVTAAAKGAVGAYGAFTREYAHLINPRPQQGATTRPFKF